MSKKELVLQFDPNTIEHLGVSLYSKLPSVLSELVSNSWDADADNVEVSFFDNIEDKKIIYSDDGHGMSFEEINEKYLLIGRNRRKSTNDETPKGRKVIGKKGLGKLSVFGICNEILLRTVKDGKLNEFLMNIDDIKKSTKTSYKPKIIHLDKPTKEKSRTYIELRGIRRKSNFRISEIASSLSKKFLIFDKLNTKLIHNKKHETIVTNELKFKNLKSQFEWSFPMEIDGIIYNKFSSVKGKVITSYTPIKDSDMRGIYLTSRGKIVNVASFYGLRDTDQFHSYVTGYLEVDFIDDLPIDVISTDRHSLNWETDETKDLNAYLQAIIKYISSEWRKKRADAKKSQLRVEKDLDVESWQVKLPSVERRISEDIINPILENSGIDLDDSTKIIGGVIEKFENKVYQEYASKIASLNKPDDVPVLLELMDEWKTVEAKQYSDLAISRIEVIKQFEEHLENDTKEVPTMHNFLKKFSWLLDPRILEFRDEVTYSKLLAETYPDDKLDEKDRRIDFLCSNALGGILYVIEIKRSKYKADMKALEQAWNYSAFLMEKYSSQSGFTKVVSYLICGEKSSNYAFKQKEETYMKSGEVFVKSYRELLEQSKEFHKEFIDLYNGLKSK